MKSGLVAALCALVLAPALTSCLPVQRTDQTETFRQVKPMISSAVDEIQAMYPDASVQTSDSPDELSSCSAPKDNSHDREWKSDDWRWIELSGEVDQTQLLDDVRKHMTAEGWKPGDNHFTNGVDQLELAHTDGGHIFLSFDGRSSNTLEIHSMSDCFYVPDHRYGSDFQ